MKHGGESVLNMRLHLFNGNITKTKTGDTQVEKILFDEYDFPVFQNDSRREDVDNDSTWSSRHLWSVIRTQKQKLTDFAVTRKQRELGKAENEDESKTKWYLTILLLEFWSRLNVPLQVLAFTFLGFGLGIKKGRGKSRNTGVIALLLLIGHYTILFLGIAMARKGQLYAGVAHFTPTILLLGCGVYFYRKFDWAS